MARPRDNVRDFPGKRWLNLSLHCRDCLARWRFASRL